MSRLVSDERSFLTIGSVVTKLIIIVHLLVLTSSLVFSKEETTGYDRSSLNCGVSWLPKNDTYEKKRVNEDENEMTLYGDADEDHDRLEHLRWREFFTNITQWEQFMRLNMNKYERINFMLANIGIIVRLNVVIDSTMYQQLNYDMQLVKKFVKTFIHELQLYYSRRELASRIRFFFVLTNLKISDTKFSDDLDMDGMLKTFLMGQDIKENLRIADVHLLLTYRNMWVSNFVKTIKTKILNILGVAYMGTFCKNPLNAPSIGLLTVRSLYSIRTMVHEMGHAFGARHDVEGHCGSEGYIMVENGYNDGPRWSKCSVDDLLAHSTRFRGCIYDPARIRDIKPIEDIDWRSRSVLDKHNPLPGEVMNLDDQCGLMFQGNPKHVNPPMGDVICQNFLCHLDSTKLVIISHRVSLTGSYCQFNRTHGGHCLFETCQP